MQETEPAADHANHRKLNICTDPGVEGHKNNHHGPREGKLGTFLFDLALCFKFEGRGRGKGGATGRVECVPESMAEGDGDVLNLPLRYWEVRRYRLAWRGPAPHHEAAVQASPSRAAVH
jgi:hypothetical protein